MSSQITCPECGALNRHRSKTCRLCGALLHKDQPPKRRIQKKLLRRTDFIAAAKANQAATQKLVAILFVIAAILGYLAGWAVQISFDFIPAEASDPILFFSLWGALGSLALLLISLIWTWIAFKRGDRIVMKMTGAQVAKYDQEPQLFNVVEEMSLAAGVPKPTIYIIETDAMNAFATGMSPQRASLGITRGLLNKLTREELQGVVGHEMGHIINWDIRYATAVSVLVGLIALISDSILRGSIHGGRHSRRLGGGSRNNKGAGVIIIIMIFFAILAPLIARLVQMAVSRQREFLADASSVRLTRHPQGLISALQKLGGETVRFEGANRATQHLFIVNPFRNFSEKASALMATHPPLDKRIQRLRNLGDKKFD